MNSEEEELIPLHVSNGTAFVWALDGGYITNTIERF
jgi:hypothetical protein